jgi:hypothetical protein
MESTAPRRSPRADENLNPDMLKFQMIFTPGDSIGANEPLRVQSFIQTQEKQS